MIDTIKKVLIILASIAVIVAVVWLLGEFVSYVLSVLVAVLLIVLVFTGGI